MIWCMVNFLFFLLYSCEFFYNLSCICICVVTAFFLSAKNGFLVISSHGYIFMDWCWYIGTFLWNWYCLIIIKCISYSKKISIKHRRIKLKSYKRSCVPYYSQVFFVFFFHIFLNCFFFLFFSETSLQLLLWLFNVWVAYLTN